MTTPPEKPSIGRRLEIPILEALPRVAELSAHPVTAASCAAALVVTIASFLGLDLMALEFDVRFLVQPWRLVTSVLEHARGDPAAVAAGLYACSPKGAGFVADFTPLIIDRGRL